MSRVLFDLDKTIVDHDTMTRFLVRRIIRNPARVLLALLVSPAVAVLVATKKRTMAASLLLWVGTFDITGRPFADVVDRYIVALDPASRLYPDAVTALNRHLDQGDEVVVVTAAAQQVAERVCGVVDSRIIVVGSTLERRFGGLVSSEHCCGSRKVAMLRERGLASGVIRAYSDSASDLPVLRLATTTTGVNMDEAVRRKIRTSLGGARRTEFVVWEKMRDEGQDGAAPSPTRRS